MSELLIDWTTPGQTPCCCEGVCAGEFPEDVQFIKQVSKQAWDLATRDTFLAGICSDFLVTFPSVFGEFDIGLSIIRLQSVGSVEVGDIFCRSGDVIIGDGCVFGTSIQTIRNLGLAQRIIKSTGNIIASSVTQITMSVNFSIYLREINRQYFLGLRYGTQYTLPSSNSVGSGYFIQLSTVNFGGGVQVGSVVGNATLLENPAIDITLPLYVNAGVQSLNFDQPTSGFFVSLFGAP